VSGACLPMHRPGVGGGTVLAAAEDLIVRGRAIALLLALLGAACAQGPPPPASLDTRNEACAHCRMGIIDARLAAQVVAPGEEPRFFDDIGCLRDYLRTAGKLAGNVTAYVADHRTSEWVPAARATYTRAVHVQTPMATSLIAHAGPASRDSDPDAAGGTPVTVADVFGPGGVPDGGRR
jgi:copper chaperone NosL